MLNVQNKNSSYFVEWIPNNVSGAGAFRVLRLDAGLAGGLDALCASWGRNLALGPPNSPHPRAPSPAATARRSSPPSATSLPAA